MADAEGGAQGGAGNSYTLPALTSCGEQGLALPSLALQEERGVIGPLLTWNGPDRGDALEEAGWKLELGPGCVPQMCEGTS